MTRSGYRLQYPDRPNLVLAYIDPVSGKRKTKSAGTANEKDAWKAAAKWEEELRAGPHCPPSKVTWADFRKRYEEEHLASLAAASARNIPARLEPHGTALEPRQALQGQRSGPVNVPNEAAGRRGSRKRASPASCEPSRRRCRGAESVGMMADGPKVIMPKGAKGRKMKGGALVGEQFDRMLAAVPKVRPKDTAEWVRYLTGLWLSGLRLAESVALSWDADAPFAVDLSGRRPAVPDQGRGAEVRPRRIDPHDARFCRVPVADPGCRAAGAGVPIEPGRRQHPAGRSPRRPDSRQDRRQGRRLVNAVDGKTASAHDLRRTFGSRWARRVMPAILQKLMRHANVQTTMQFYVDLDVDEMADDLWAKHPATAGTIPPGGNISGNISPETAEVDGSPNAVT